MKISIEQTDWAIYRHLGPRRQSFWPKLPKFWRFLNLAMGLLGVESSRQINLRSRDQQFFDGHRDRCTFFGKKSLYVVAKT